MGEKKRTRRSNGEGTIYYNEKSKKWIGQFTANGKRKSICRTKKSGFQRKCFYPLFLFRFYNVWINFIQYPTLLYDILFPFQLAWTFGFFHFLSLGILLGT